jgi:hypothetical protein
MPSKSEFSSYLPVSQPESRGTLAISLIPFSCALLKQGITSWKNILKSISI